MQQIYLFWYKMGYLIETNPSFASSWRRLRLLLRSGDVVVARGRVGGLQRGVLVVGLPQAFAGCLGRGGRLRGGPGDVPRRLPLRGGAHHVLPLLVLPHQAQAREEAQDRSRVQRRRPTGLAPSGKLCIYLFIIKKERTK